MGPTGRRLGVVVALAASVVVLVPASSMLESGPIVQCLGPRSAKIVLHGSTRQRLVLRYGAVRGRLDRTATEVDPRRRHVLSLTRLEPDSVVHYEIAPESRSRVWRGHFRTAPQPGTGHVRFAAFGDSGRIPWWVKVSDLVPVEPAAWLRDILPGRGAQWEVSSTVVRQHPDLWLHLGDVVYPRGRLDHYPEAFLLPFAELLARAPCYPTIGNHDLMTDGGAPFYHVFELPQRTGPARGRWYDFVHGPVHFLCLDSFSSSLAPGSKQRTWLEGRLAASRSPWRVVYTHRPFWTASRSRFDPANAKLREEIHPLLERFKVQLVLSGHDHVYQRYRRRDHVHYVVAGHGGKSLYALHEDDDLALAKRDYGFVLVDADPKRMVLRAIATTGEVIDELEIVK